MNKMNKIGIGFMLFYLFGIFSYAQSTYKEYSDTSFYVAYDSNDKANYLLVMPLAKKVYTHKAGDISNLKQIDTAFKEFPTYNNGKLCFGDLKTINSGAYGALTIANKCYDVDFFYTQKGKVDKKSVFMLYYKSQLRVYEGFARNAKSFKIVKDQKGFYDNHILAGIGYEYFTFNLSNALVTLGKKESMDKIKPIITLNGAASVTVTQGDTYSDAGATAIDDRDGIVKVSTKSNVNTSKPGVYKVTYTAKDLANNIAIRTRIVMVKAKVITNKKPTVTAGADKRIEVNKNYVFNAHATDSDGTIVSYVWREGAKVLSNTQTVRYRARKLGVYRLNVTVKDNKNATATDTLKVTVVDIQKPIITLNGSAKIILTEGDTYIEKSAKVSDNYDSNLKVSKSGSVNATKAGTYTITYNAIDSSKNRAVSVKRTVIVKKKVVTPPVLTMGPVVEGIDNETLTLVANCASCHGMESPLGANEIPVIQGLGKNYLSRVLSGYKTAKHHSYVMNRIMDGYSALDIDKMSAYYAKQTWQGQALKVSDATVLQQGANLYGTNCVVCHQSDGIGVDAPTKGIILKGQNEHYLQNTLMHYAKGLHGDAHAAMKSIFKNDIGVSSTKINALAHYLANGLSVETTTNPTSDDTEKPVIKLKGARKILIQQGRIFNDPGYIVSDNVDTVFNVKVTGDVVDTHKIGTYYRYYDVTDTAGNNAIRQTRTIEVKAKVIDKIKPVITLEGTKNMTLLQFDRYIEPGYSAVDNVDGILVVDVKGSVDRTKNKTYTITYTAIDSAGNKSIATRKVTVRARKVYPTYPDGIGKYGVGTEVLGSTGKVYRCKIAGWCNQHHIAYYPGTGFGWTDAWEEVGSPDPQTPAVDAPPTTPVLLSATYNYGTKQIDVVWKPLSTNTQKVDIIVDGKILNTVIGSKKTSGSASGTFKLDTTYYVSLNAMNETGSKLSNEITLDIRNRTDKGKILYNENCKVCHGTNGTNKKDLTLWDESSSFAQWTHDSNMPNGYINGLNNSELNLIGNYVKEILIPRSQTTISTHAIDVNSTISRGYRALNSIEYKNTLYALFEVSKDTERKNKLSLDASSMPLDNLVSGYNSDRSMNRIDEDKVKFFNKVAYSYERYIDRINGSSGPKCTIGGYNFCKANKTTFLNTFATKIFRRPLTQSEKTDYMKNSSVGQIIGDMLVSPHFLYRSEMGKRVANTNIYKLTQYEIATAIAYAMSGSTPDDRLLNLAKLGRFDSVNVRTTEAVRLFGSKTGKKRLDDFIGRWLLSDDYRNLADKNPKRFPGYTDEIKKAQSEQILKFFRMVLEDPEDSTYSDLFVNTKWVTTKALSKFYSEGTSDSSIFEEISATSKRYGMLTLGAVASKYANSEESHPFKRGNFVLERLMCQPMGLPGNGGDVPAIKDHAGENKRDRYSTHVNDSSCATCHNLLDPIGYVWERYDGAGRYRTKEWHESKYGGPKSIDTSVTLKGILTFDESEEMPANSVRDLSEYIAASDRGPECMAMQYYRYISGESEAEIENNEVVRKLYEDFKGEGYDLAALFTNIVGTQSFITREGK